MSGRHLPTIKDIPLESENYDILSSVKMTIETREGLRGTVEDRNVTVQDLIDLGLTTKADFEKMLRGR